MGNDQRQNRNDRKPLTNKQLRDREFFRRTPQLNRVTRDEQLSRNSEEENRRWDIDQCIVEGCPIWQLRNPRSILGKEAPKLHAEQLAEAAAKATVQAVADREAKRKAKRAASQKASRQRKAAAKRAAAADAGPQE